MATAAQDAPDTKVASGSPMSVAVYKDNGGRFHWRLVAGDGRHLATSVAIFASADDAERSASDVRESARSLPMG